MINKSQSATPTTSASVDAATSSANTQTVMGNLVDVSNTSNTSISALPLEMIHHVGSFLKLRDKISFSQALIDSGLSVPFDEGEILRKFNDEFLTEKINILLDCPTQHYDFSKFYTSDTQNEEVNNLYSFLFNQMCEDFRKRTALSEEIVALVESIEATAFVMRANHDNPDEVEEVINSEILDGERIQAYVDRADPNEPKNITKLVDHLFPNLTCQDVRKEIEERVQEFDSKEDLVARQFSYTQLVLTKNLLAFLKMDEKYRGIPIKVAARTQKLASSHLQPIIQKANENMQTMPTEELRAWLIMAMDKEQIESFCEKMIEVAVKDNPFYAKGSPYYPMLKHDLLHRMDLFSAIDEPLYIYGSQRSNDAYMYGVSYCADSEYLTKHLDILMSKLLEVQIKNGEDPVSESYPKELISTRLAYFREIKILRNQMEAQYGMTVSLKQAYQSRLALAKELTPEPDTLEENSPEYRLSSFVRGESSFFSLMRLFRANPDYVNAQDVNGDTFLHLAIKIGSDMVKTLVNLNTDLNIKNAQGLTPLMLAVQSEDMYITGELLKQQNLDVNKCDDLGNTALHHAILANKKMVMHRLLRHGATDKTIVNAEGKTPRELAGSVGLLSLYDSLDRV